MDTEKLLKRIEYCERVMEEVDIDSKIFELCARFLDKIDDTMDDFTKQGYAILGGKIYEK